MNRLLSQEEINALLKETPDLVQASNVVSNEVNPATALDAMEKDVLGELANISMGSAATALSSLLGKKTSITTPRISVTTLDQIQKDYPQTYLFVKVNYTNGLEGVNVLILHIHDAGIFVDLMMEGDGSNTPQELSEQHLSAISEAMAQMMNASTTALTQILKKPIEISSPVLNIVNFEEEHPLAKESENNVVKIAFNLIVEDLVDSEMMQILPVSFAKQMVSELYKENDVNSEQVENNVEKKSTNQDMNISNKISSAAVAQEYTEPIPQRVEVTAPQLPTFQEQTTVQSSMPPNLDLIMDIGLQLSVELGRAKKKIKEILKLTNGSIVELDKLAGEPVDILVNDKLLAKGEVVIIDENFGVRVTEIVSPTERIKNLK